MDISWDDLRTVLALVRGGTLAAAAKDLGVAYTTVARRIARVEAAMGVTLFERLADGYKPTETAKLVAEHAAQMEQSQDALLRGVSGRDRRLTGTLTITAPQLLIGQALGPAIDAFCKAYPEVRLDVRATNTPLDLARREADLAIRISREPGDSLMGLRLVEQQMAAFAAPDVADRIAQDHQSPIDWLNYAALEDVPKGVDPSWPNHRVRIRFDDMVAILGAAQAGLGVARVPFFLGRTTAGLVQVPVLPPQPYMDIWIVAHRDVWPSAKVTAFREILTTHMRANRALYVA